MDRILTYTVQPDEENMLLLDFLRSKGFSRGILSSMKPYKGAIQLNGERGFGKSVLHAGNFLRIHIPETENSENILPVKMDLSILYEDEDLLVINKPADMPVHPSIGNYDNTLANGAAWYFKEKGQTFVYSGEKSLQRRSSLRPDEAAADPPDLSGNRSGDHAVPRYHRCAYRTDRRLHY